MKKLIKRTTITLVAVFALISFGGTALAASGYINWNGTDAYQNILVTLESISNRGKELKSERDTANQSNEQLINQIKDKENVIKDKENAIKAKEQEIIAKQKEIDQFKGAATNNSDQLKQAEQDMADVNSKATDVLNGME